MREQPVQPPETAPPEAESEADLFTPGLLHELRQPLMAIDAAATLLERELGTPLARHGDWRMLRSQLARLVEIMRGYEELLRPGEIEPSAFPVEAVVSRAVDLLAHRVRPLAGRFSFARNGAHEGFGAPGALVHAATNVISTALDALEGAGGAARIPVRVVAPARGAVEVRVSDEGTGIPADARAHIFEPRFTTKPPGKGTGLGLHVARRLMSRYGGGVRLVDEGDPARLPWAVTEFCIQVPAPPAGGAP